MAALNNSIEAAQVLYSYGADLTVRDSHDMTALRIAVKRGFLDFAEFLNQAAHEEHADPVHGVARSQQKPFRIHTGVRNHY